VTQRHVCVYIQCVVGCYSVLQCIAVCCRFHTACVVCLYIHMCVYSVCRRVLWRVAVYCSALPILSASIEPSNVVQQCVWLCMHSDSVYDCNVAATRALGMYELVYTNGVYNGSVCVCT